MSEENYLVREAEKSETNDIFALLKQNYIYKENLHQSYISKHANEISQEEKEILENYAQKLVEHLLTSFPCLVAVHRETKCISGSLILEPSNLTDEKESTTEATVPTKTLEDLFSYMKIIYKNARIPENFPTADKKLHLRFLCVDRDHRQNNLSTLLLKRGVEWGRENQFDVAYGLFTSVFSRKAAANAGMKSILDCNLQDFRDSDGSSAFADVTPHNVISVMAIDLQS